jgi:hypothetical protein
MPQMAGMNAFAPPARSADVHHVAHTGLKSGVAPCLLRGQLQK